MGNVDHILSWVTWIIYIPGVRGKSPVYRLCCWTAENNFLYSYLHLKWFGRKCFWFTLRSSAKKKKKIRSLQIRVLFVPPEYNEYYLHPTATHGILIAVYEKPSLYSEYSYGSGFLWFESRQGPNFIFSKNIQTGSTAHPAPCSMGTGAICLAVKWPERFVKHSSLFKEVACTECGQSKPQKGGDELTETLKRNPW